MELVKVYTEYYLHNVNQKISYRKERKYSTKVDTNNSTMNFYFLKIWYPRKFETEVSIF